MRRFALIFALLAGLCHAQTQSYVQTQGTTITGGTFRGFTIAFPEVFFYSPNPVAIGNCLVGQICSRIATLTNNGGAVLEITGFAFSPPTSLFTIAPDSCSGTFIPPQGTCTITVNFIPTATGVQNATIDVSDGNGDTMLVNATGTSGGTPLLCWTSPNGTSPSPINFGSVEDGTNATVTVTLSNCGTANLMFNTLSPSGAPFTLPSDSCSGQTLAPAAICPISAEFNPTSAIGYTGSIAVPDNTATNPDSIPLIGSGSTLPVAPQISYPPGCSTPPCALPEGYQGSPYSFGFTAFGGAPPYTWLFTSGTLPSGLILNALTGVVSGTTAIAGTTSLTIQVTDTAAQTNTLAVTLLIGVVNADFYVSPVGSDSTPCTNPTAPCLNVGHGSHLQALINAKPCTAPGYVVDLMAPVGNAAWYDQAIRLTSTDGPAGATPTATCPVTYQAYPGQFPIISGGLEVTSNTGGSWAPCPSDPTCAAAFANGFTAYETEISNGLPDFEFLYYYDQGPTNYSEIRYRPRMGSQSFPLTAVANGTVTSGVGSTTYTGTFPAAGTFNPLNCGVTAAATYSCKSIFISGFTNPANNGVFKLISATTPHIVVQGATGVAETHAATAIDDVGLYGHSCQNSGTCNTWGSGNLADFNYYTTAIDNGIPNASPGSYPSCNLSSPNDCEGIAFDKWVVDRERVTHINTSTNTINTGCSPNCRSADVNSGPGPVYQDNYRYLLENVKEEFKQGGQWFRDRSSTNPNAPNWTLYYVAMSGENPNTDIVVIPSQSSVLTLTSVAYTTFGPGLTFQQGDNWTVPATGYLSAQLDYNLPGTQAGILCNPCNHVTFIGNTVADSATVGISLQGNGFGNLVTENTVYATGAYGIRESQAPKNIGSVTDFQVPRNDTISQNYFWYPGEFIASADSAGAGLSNNINFINNDLGFSPHGGIEICMPGQPSPGYCSSTPANSGSHGVFGWLFQGNWCHNIGQGVSSDTACMYAATPNSAASGSGVNVSSGNRANDLNSGAVNGDTSDVGIHFFYLDSYTGNWTVNDWLGYRSTASGSYMNKGPQVAGQPNVYSNNIEANIAGFPSQTNLYGCQGVNAAPPTNSILQLIRTSNICTMDLPTRTLANSGHGPQSGAALATQKYVSNLYSGITTFTVDGAGTKNFSAWQTTYGEDAGGTISTTIPYAAPGNCALNSTVPQPGRCDDFTLTSCPGHGFNCTTFPTTWGVTTVGVKVPPFLPDTWPIATLPLAQF